MLAKTLYNRHIYIREIEILQRNSYEIKFINIVNSSICICRVEGPLDGKGL